MNQIVSEATINILDRKYDFVINSPTDSFMLDFHVFMDFLHKDELVKDFTFKVREEFDERARGYLKLLEGEKQEAIEIKNAFIEKYPELDDSNVPQPTGLEDLFSWESTFAYFDKVAHESFRSGHALESDMMDDNSDVRRLIDLLSNKIAVYNHRHEKGETEAELEKSLSYRVMDLEKAHSYVHREWVNYARVSAGHTLYELEEIIKRINPEPEDQTEWRNLPLLDKANRAIAKVLEEKRFEWITDATYGVISKWANYRPGNFKPEQLEQVFAQVKQQLKRVYEAIRQEIGTTRLLLQILDRYRMRCHWYDHEHLRSLVLQDGEFISNREDVLTRHLALYVFDLGVTVIYRARFGKHEVDLVELDAKHPMFIEAKAYKDSTAKTDLVSGVSQLHGYLSSLDAHKHISDAYYVIYRLGGPIYEFPRQISTSRFTIHPVLVDLGLASESGRNQPKPILISKEEIMGEIKK